MAPGGAPVYETGDAGTQVYRVLKTTTLVISWICLGLFNEVVGPTLGALRWRVGADYEQIGRVLSARSAGLFVGSVVGGFLHDRFIRQRDLLLVVAMVLVAATITAAPWCHDLWLLALLFHIMGHGHGLLTTGGNPLLAFLWADKAAGPYNVLHCGFGAGAAIAPYIATPFMVETIRPDTASNSTTTASWNVSTSLPDDALSSIQYPYLIVGMACIFTALLFLGFFLKKPPSLLQPEPVTNSKDIFKLTRCTAEGETRFGVTMLVLIFFFYFSVVSGERAYGKFVFSFAKESALGFNNDNAALLNSVYWISFTVGRLVAALLARWIPIHILLFIQVSGTLFSAIMLNVFHDKVIPFWIFTSLFGFMKSPLFPSGLAWANRYMAITSMTIVLVNIGSSSGGMLVQWLTGYMFEYHGPRTFLYIIIAYSSLIFILFILMHIVATRHGDRYAHDAPPAECQVYKSDVTISRKDSFDDVASVQFTCPEGVTSLSKNVETSERARFYSLWPK